jgi:hypothetical protein
MGTTPKNVRRTLISEHGQLGISLTFPPFMHGVKTYHRPGDKNQLKAQDVTAKLVRFDILRKVPKNNLFCIKHT